MIEDVTPRAIGGRLRYANSVGEHLFTVLLQIMILFTIYVMVFEL